jgi:hypothetical protein
MRTIRASEIGAFIFCQRAWWYQKTGVESSNQPEMASGSELHYRHARRAMATGCIRSLGIALLLITLGLAVAALVIMLLE